jgi:hypothetical protein
MPASPPLDRLQRWMQGVVVHPGSIDEALASPAAMAETASASEFILPSQTLTPEERIEIYQGMYVLRMADALASDYPSLKHFLGEHGFFELVRDYVQVYPSRSYTLNRLGDHLPEFLMNARGQKHQAFLADLARLELAVAEVFDAPEGASLSASQIGAVRVEEWERAVLRVVPAFQLLSLRYNANDYTQAVKQAKRVPRPRLKQAWVAIYRRGYAVYRHELPHAAHDLLFDLARGICLGQAVQAALERPGRRPQEQQLFRWFREWVSGGIFASVRILG